MTEPIRQNDNLVTETANSADDRIKTISVESLIRSQEDISVLKNGWPNWGLRNRDLKVLEGYVPSISPYINSVFSMLMPYVSLSMIKESNSTEEGETNEQESSAEDSYSDNADVEDLDNAMFSNNELMSSLANPIPKDELGFLSFGRNRISIKNVTIDIEETTGLYSVKNFKFSFVIHRPTEFTEAGIIRNIFDPSKKFIFKWGYNIDLTNTDILPSAARISSIVGAQNKDTIMFNKWDIKQEDNDNNIEVDAEAIPVSSKAFVTVKMGEHNLNPDDSNALQNYEDSLKTIENINNNNSNNRENKEQEKTKKNIQSKINELIINAFSLSMSNITKTSTDIKFSDLLDEISRCVNYSLEKNEQENATFKFACGKFNNSIKANNDYIGDFLINVNSFTKDFVAKIKKDKNVPHPLDFLDQIINEYLSDYTDFRSLSSDIDTLLKEKETQEAILKKQTSHTRNRDALNSATEALKKVDEKLKKITMPTIKFFVHEHRTDDNKIFFYCFIIDSSFGLPAIYESSEQTAFERVIESNRGSGILLEDSDLTQSEISFLNGDDNAIMTDQGVTSFDIPIINLFSENSIVRSQSLTSETDEEIQSSLIKRMVDKNEQGDSNVENVSFNDQFKFLTTKIDAKTLGMSAWQIYQPIFWRLFLKDSIFERLYNVTKLTHEISEGAWDSSITCTMCAI